MYSFSFMSLSKIQLIVHTSVFFMYIKNSVKNLEMIKRILCKLHSIWKWFVDCFTELEFIWYDSSIKCQIKIIFFNPNAASHFVEVCRLWEFLFRKLSNMRSYMLHFVCSNHTCNNNVLGLKNSKSFSKLLIIFYLHNTSIIFVWNQIPL